MVEYVVRHLQGHRQYYGVSENGSRLSSYFYHATNLLFKWLNRRSQKRSYNWEEFKAKIKPLLPKPQIMHSFYAVKN